MTMVPQYTPVRPTGRSHAATRMRPASVAMVRPVSGRAVGMAPKISPRCLAAPGPGGVEKEGGGGRGRAVEDAGGDIVAPRPHDCSGNFVPRDSPSQLRRKRGCRTCGLWLTAYGCNDLLRSPEQDRAVLQERPSLAYLRRADQLAPPDENLSADRAGEAGSRAVEAGGARWRAVNGQSRGHTKRPERRRQPSVDRAVGFAQAAERRDRGGHRVGHFMFVPYRPAARGASHHVEAAPRDGRAVVAGGGRLVPAQREARWVEALQPQEGSAGPGGLGEEGGVDG